MTGLPVLKYINRVGNLFCQGNRLLVFPQLIKERYTNKNEQEGTNRNDDKGPSAFLFLFRSVGQILFFLTKKEVFLFFFPNVFEVFFHFYLFSTILPFLQPFTTLPKAILPLITITILVLTREYILHIQKANLFNFFLKKESYWIDDKKLH